MDWCDTPAFIPHSDLKCPTPPWGNKIKSTHFQMLCVVFCLLFHLIYIALLLSGLSVGCSQRQPSGFSQNFNVVITVVHRYSKAQCVGLRGIHWQKCYMIFITILALVYSHLKIKIIGFFGTLEWTGPLLPNLPCCLLSSPEQTQR